MKRKTLPLIAAVEPEATAPTAPVTITCEIRVPMVRLPKHIYLADHLEVRRLSPLARVGLKRLTAGLDAEQARTGSGRRVTLGTHAVMWLLEELGKSEPVTSTGRADRADS